jgi:hypothetical protein
MLIVIGFIFGLLKLGLFLALVIFVLSLVTKTKFQDWLSPSRWRSVFIYVLKWLLFKFFKEPYPLLESYEIEQFQFRIKSCEKCLPTNKCENCGCNTIARMNVTTDICSAGRWPSFMDKESWEKFKLDNKIEINVTVDGIDIRTIDF